MRFLKPIIAGAIGTTFMTLYSYGYSRFRRKQFREPVLLAHLLEGKEEPQKRKEMIKGWVSHYLVGSVFSLTYEAFFKGRFMRNSRLKGLVFGGLYGLLGVGGWKITFGAHPQPPKIDYPEYYRHLILAHLVFGYFAFGRLEKQAKEKGA